MKLIKINEILIRGIELSTFTEKLKEIGVGPKFALSTLMQTASYFPQNNFFVLNKCEYHLSHVCKRHGFT